MPNYEYKCPKCGGIEERSHSSSRTLKFKCQDIKCRGKMEWQFPAPAIDHKSDHPKFPRPSESLRVKTKNEERVYEKQTKKGEFSDGSS